MINDNYISQAILALAPNAHWALKVFEGDYADEYLEWYEESLTKPTVAEINAKAAELRQAYIDTEYQRKRIPEYPSIGDQLDALWKGGEAAAEMLAKVQAVKNKYPKPE